MAALNPPLSADRTAVLIVDMQNGFCHPQGSFGRAGADVSGCGAATPGCAALVEAARAVGIPVVWTRAIHEDDLSDWRMLTEVPMYAPLRGIGSCVEGTWDAEFVEGLAPAPEDIVVSKSRFSPFVETDLADRLRALGVENLLVGGVGTSACVESTVRDASQPTSVPMSSPRRPGTSRRTRTSTRCTSWATCSAGPSPSTTSSRP
jgi:ureidoacrylate peracid hydrolase